MTPMWWRSCPAMMYASARTVTGLPEAMPLRTQAASSKLWNNSMLAERRWRYWSRSAGHSSGLASVVAGIVLAGDVDSLEVIAGVALADVDADRQLTFDDIPNDVLFCAEMDRQKRGWFLNSVGGDDWGCEWARFDNFSAARCR